MKSLTTPIVVPNIAKWKVLRVSDYQDDTPQRLDVCIQMLGNGNVTYNVVTLSIYDSQESLFLFANAAALSYGDRISSGSKLFAGAYTTISAANKSTGNRNAQLQAVETALLTAGIIDASLAGT